jgi:hypothetical protein
MHKFLRCAWLVRHLGKDVGESTNDDDVILLYIEAFLIR